MSRTLSPSEMRRYCVSYSSFFDSVEPMTLRNALYTDGMESNFLGSTMANIHGVALHLISMDL